MSKVFIEEETLIGIGNAIREKNGTTDLIATTDMATAISNLPTGGGELKYAQKTYTASGISTSTMTYDLSDIINYNTPFMIHFTAYASSSVSATYTVQPMSGPLILYYDGNGTFTKMLKSNNSFCPDYKFKSATLDENCLLTITGSASWYVGGSSTHKTFYLNIFYTE